MALGCERSDFNPLLYINKRGFQHISRTYGTESGIFGEIKSEVTLGLKLQQQKKLKSLIFKGAQ